MLLLYLSFACLLYFTCMYIVRNDENKDVQSINIYHTISIQNLNLDVFNTYLLVISNDD